VKVDGTLWCWGLDGSSTGTGSTGAVLSPTQVHLGSPSASVASVTGSFAVYALTTDGRLFGWGEDSEGEVGDGNTARVAKVVDPFRL
jgi:alpha-tubulin suppressor-like RCC1 family protein